MMSRIPTTLVLVSAAAMLLTNGTRAQQSSPLANLKTTAEASDYKSTSTYADVMAFVKTVVSASPAIMHYTTMGTTTEGREMPLVVVGTGLKDASPAAVRATGKLRVYVQANIHAGEVEGKESAQILLRELGLGQHREWLQSMVLLINPIYNADGNERFSMTDRGQQNGPINGQGTRANGQSLNINRDYMKLETPEGRAMVKVFNDYDPYVGLDLHTTDGTCASYYLTYAPPLNPNTNDTIMSVMKQDWFPYITNQVRAKDHMEMFYYGDVEGGDTGCSGGRRGGTGGAAGGGRGTGRGRDTGTGATGAAAGAAQTAAGARGATAQGGGQAGAAGARQGRGGGAARPQLDGPAWVTFEHVPRFNNNYIGLRNRFALLSEAYSYATFKDRIAATTYFVDEALDFANTNAAKLKKVCADADKEKIIGKTESTSSRIKTGGKISILMGGVETEINPNNGATMWRRTDEAKPVDMYDRMWFEPVTTETVPSAYYVPETATSAIALLRAHGIEMQQITRPVQNLESFTIASNTTIRPGNPQDFGTHQLRRLDGAWQASPDATAATGAWMVPMTQPLARLAFYLLEPKSDDGLTAWNVLDDLLKDDVKTYPILRKR